MENGNVQVLNMYNRYLSNNSVAPEVRSTGGYVPDLRSRTALLRKKIEHDRKFTITLFIICVLLAVTVIVLACSYVFTRNRTTIRVRICETEECIRSAANLKLAMNSSVDPCDDFYAFTCGRWTSEHPDHGWFVQNSAFAIIEEKIVFAALKFLQSNASASEPKPVRQTRDMYQACMDTDTLDKLGYDPLIKYLNQLGLPAIPTFMNMTDFDEDYKFNWIKTEAAMTRLLAMQLFIGVSVEPDPLNTTKNCIVMGVPNMQSPLPSPLKQRRKRNPFIKFDSDSDEAEETVSAYKDYMFFVMKHVILSNATDIPEDIDERLDIALEVILRMEVELSEFRPENDTDSDTYIAIPAETLQNSTNQLLESLKFNVTNIWGPLLMGVFEGTAVTLDLNRTDLIHIDPNHIEYLLMVVGFLSGMPEVLVELWVWWMTVNALIVNTTTEIREFILKQSAYFTGVMLRSRSVNCAFLVNDFMGMAVSYAIVDKQFLIETKPKIQQMLGDIKDAFASRVKDITWMDELTKQVTLEKSKEMTSFIGFPDWLLQEGKIDDYYQNVTVRNDSHLDNMVGIIKVLMKEMLETLHDTNSNEIWHSDPITVNAYNFFLDNSITVPMAVLLFPLYNLGMEVLNYGAIGSILGHELTHGFDNTGRKYDKYGNYRQWWTNSTIEKFENLTTCFVNNYNNYYIPEIKKNIDGRLTLGENIADNGGIHHAYLAYKNYVNRNGVEPMLPGFERYTADQLFFIAFGSVWCDDANAAALEYQIVDEHSPNKIRVLGTLRNSEEFAKAYNCPAGSYMNPREPRCRIW